MDRLRVCLILEGSYPFITGGVSAWVDDLVRSLSDVDFALLTISPGGERELRYRFPENIVSHTDIVINENRKSTRRISLSGLVSAIERFHTDLAAGSDPDMAGLLRFLPEGYYPYTAAAKNDRIWALLAETNRRRNPLYPFSDYFWAWKSAHDMMFTALGAPIPPADIYHTISTGFAGLAGVAAKYRRGKPLLLTEHGLYHKEREIEIRKTGIIKGYQRDMWIGLYTNLSRICYRNADTITSLFEENRRKQMELGAPEKRCVVIPNGIDIERFTVERRKREGFHVGLVGRVVPIKDVRTFILTAKIVLDRIEDAFFHCIGPTDEDPEYFETCVRLVSELKIADRFTFTGRADVREYYRFLDVLVLTSVREAQPLVILEAYAARIPVVSTGVGNVPELLEYDHRFIAPSKDPQKLASGICFIHDNPGTAAALIEGNRRKVERFYDKRDLHRRFAALYAAMAGRKNQIWPE